MNLFKKLDYNRIYFVVLLSAVFMFGFTYVGMDYLWMKPLAIVLGVLVAAGALLQRHIEFDLRFIILFEAMLLVAAKDDRNYIVYEVKYGWILVLGYLLGKLAVGQVKSQSDSRIKQAYFVMAGAMATLGFMDLIYSARLGFFDTEQVYNWIRDEKYVRTTLELAFILTTAALFWAVYSFGKNKVLSAIIICCVLVILQQMIKHQGRFNLLTCILSIPMMIVIYVYSEWKTFSPAIKKGVYILFGAGIAMVLFSIICFAANIFGLRDMYQHSYLSGSGGILKNVRFSLMLESFQSMPANPWGGYEPGKLGTSHNMWIEYQRHHGTAVFILLELYKLLAIKDVVVLTIRRGKNYSIKYLLVPAFTFLNLYYTMEPNGFANRWFLLFGLFLSGMIRAKLELEEKGDYEKCDLKGKAQIHAATQQD